MISADTWRHEAGREACAAGADLINDSWGGWDPRLAEVAAEFGAGLVCAHVGRQRPRTRPFRVAYADVMADVLGPDARAGARARVAAGVEPDRIIIDAAHDFGKNTWHSLEITRRLAEMAATGWPVLVSLSNKDFVGETLDLPPTSGCRARSPRRPSAPGWAPGSSGSTRCARPGRSLDMVAAIRGDTPPARAVRGLA